MIAVKSLILAVSLFGGGQAYLDKSSIEAISNDICSTYEHNGTNNLFSSNYTFKKSNCTLIIMKSGKQFQVTDSIESVMDGSGFSK